MEKGKVLLALLAVVAALAAGCAQTGLTKPARSATEQLLLSTAAEESLAQMDFTFVTGRKIFVDRVYFEAHDKDFVIGSIRDHIARHGGLLVAKAEEAQIVVEPRSGALSIDASGSIIGIPESSAPLPISGAVQIPEMALYKSEKHFSIAKLALLAYDQSSRAHVRSTGPHVGRANIKYYKFLGFISYTKTTLPEKKRQKKT